MLLYSSTPIQVWMKDDEESKALISNANISRNKTNKNKDMQREWIAVLAQMIFGIIVIFATISGILTSDDEHRCLNLMLVVWVRVFFSLIESLSVYIVHRVLERKCTAFHVMLLLTAHLIFLGTGIVYALQCPFRYSKYPEKSNDLQTIWTAVLYGFIKYGYVCADFCISIGICIYITWKTKTDKKWLNTECLNIDRKNNENEVNASQ